MKKERVGGVAEMARTLAGGRSTQTVQNSTRVRGGGARFLLAHYLWTVCLYGHTRDLPGVALVITFFMTLFTVKRKT